MDKKKINTRFIFRNDTIENWESSDVLIYQGEVALARLSGDLSNKYEARIGTGDKTWSQLSASNFIIPVESVKGLEDKIKSLSTSYYETPDIGQLSTKNYVNGDIAVEKKLVSGSISSYCAYRYSTTVSAWQALDGNYRADNVYFDQDIDLAGSYTQVGNIKLTDGVISAAGKTVKQVFENIFNKVIQPTLSSAPTASVTLTSAGAKEVGTSFTPNWSVSFNQGKYEQPWHQDSSGKNVLVNDGTAASTYSVSDTASGTATTSSGSFATFTVGDSTSYKVSATVGYTAGEVAKDNKGNDSDPVVRRAAGTTASASSSTVTGWRRCFWGYRTAAEGAITEFTSANIRDNIHATASRNYSTDTKAGYTQSNAGNSAFILKFKVLAGTKQLIFAVPHSLNVSSYAKCTMTNTSIGQLQLDNGNMRQTGKCSVEGLNSYAAADYDIWTYTADGSFAADTEYTISWSAS